MRSQPGRKMRLKASPEQLRAAGLLVDEPLPPGPIDLRALFGNARPVEIEIGAGKGAFLLRRAAARPDLNLLGIEWLGGYAAYAADRARRAGLANVRVLCADAEDIFAQRLADESVWRVHIYFPDPWPKRRHRRRRLIKPDFAAHLRRVLRAGGTVRIVTDHAEYFRQIRRVLAGTPGLAAVLPPPAGQSANGLVGSNFERKYLAAGRCFYATAAIRYAQSLSE